ncbi:MAG: hypothetical protein Q7S23_00785 [bacterium]|nr:hypothetical protein [bacterium]
MLFHKKEEMYLGSFTRLVVGTFLKSDTGDISLVDRENLLNTKERAEVKSEIELLRLIILLFQLMEISHFGKKEYSPQELGKIIGIGVGFAYQDIGLSKEESVKKVERLFSRIEYYSDAMEKTDQQKLKSRGQFFYLIKYFTDLIIIFETGKMVEQNFQERHFVVFELGKQVYQHDKKAFEEAIKNVKFLDE